LFFERKKLFYFSYTYDSSLPNQRTAIVNPNPACVVIAFGGWIQTIYPYLLAPQAAEILRQMAISHRFAHATRVPTVDPNQFQFLNSTGG
jgi:hypothetical protein